MLRIGGHLSGDRCPTIVGGANVRHSFLADVAIEDVEVTAVDCECPTVSYTGFQFGVVKLTQIIYLPGRELVALAVLSLFR